MPQSPSIQSCETGYQGTCAISKSFNAELHCGCASKGRRLPASEFERVWQGVTPSAIILAAPAPPSSAGWNRILTVPCAANHGLIFEASLRVLMVP